MSKEIQMKQHILNLIEQMLMGEEGGKFKPKAISVEMMGKPKVMEMDDKEEMPEHMESLVGDDEMPEDMDDEEGEDKPKMSLKEFLANRA
jgi:hypothetical protein